MGVFAGTRLSRTPAPGLADGKALPGRLLLPLRALGLPRSSGPCPAGRRCFGGGPGTAPRGAAEAVGTLGWLPHRPGRLRGASASGGPGGGAPGGARGLARPWGGGALRAQGQAGLARVRLGRGARGVGPGLGGSAGHRDGGAVVRAAGGAHVGRPVHGQRGRRGGLTSWGRGERRPSGAVPCRCPQVGTEDAGGRRPQHQADTGLLGTRPTRSPSVPAWNGAVGAARRHR